MGTHHLNERARAHTHTYTHTHTHTGGVEGSDGAISPGNTRVRAALPTVAGNKLSNVLYIMTIVWSIYSHNKAREPCEQNRV